MKLLPFLLLLLLPAVVQAQFTFTTNNGAITITGYTGSNGVVTIPGTINGLPVIIGDYAFAYSGSLTNLTIMNGVTGIGKSAFNSCPNLTSVTIPGSVTNIGEYAFNFCQKLTNAMILNGVANIGTGAFRITSVESITIPGSVTNIGPNAFEFCTKLASVTISNGVTSIGDSAFFDCYWLASVSIPSSVVTIGVSAFSGCDSMTNIAVDVVNSNYASVAGVLFNKKLNTLVECPSRGNGSLSYIIPGGVTSIGDSAFAGCLLTNVTIPSGVSSIGDNAFNDCYRLPIIEIPGSVTNIGNFVFGSCTAMTNITVDPINPNYASADGVLFDKIFSTLIQYPTGKPGYYVIPNSVATITSAAFEVSAISGVTIPNSVTSIGTQAFWCCCFISDVTIPGSLRNIGSYVFWNCYSLTNVTILNGVTNIDSWAFGACYGLTTVTIPGSVQSIGVWAFEDCTSLTNVYCLGNAPTVVSSVFAGDNTVFYSDPGTVYYLPGTTGWTNTFGGLPTAEWYLPNPMILNNGSGLGVRTNRFGFTISWATNVLIVVEACTNLSNPDWQPVQTNTLTTGSAYFSDPQWTNYPGRFYRLRSP